MSDPFDHGSKSLDFMRDVYFFKAKLAVFNDSLSVEECVATNCRLTAE